jgi:hypothetical protein
VGDTRNTYKIFVGKLENRRNIKLDVDGKIKRSGLERRGLNSAGSG